MTAATISTIRALHDNFIHIVHDSDRAIAVDPSAAGPVLQFLEGKDLALTHILITHHHADHTGGCLELREATGCRIVGPPDRRIDCADTADTKSIPTRTDGIHTPGHTASHTCYYLPALNALFSGDTLFLGGCGRLLEGSAHEMWHSLLKLRRLPDATEVYPGHDYTMDNLQFCQSVLPGSQAIAARIQKIMSAGTPSHAPISEERATNVFLMCDEPSFADRTGLSGYPADIFAELRSRKDSW